MEPTTDSPCPRTQGRECLRSKLSEGGEEGPCGWLKDLYGLSWQIVPTALIELVSDPDTEKSQAAIKAMLGMRKIDIEALRRAANQT